MLTRLVAIAALLLAVILFTPSAQAQGPDGIFNYNQFMYGCQANMLHDMPNSSPTFNYLSCNIDWAFYWTEINYMDPFGLGSTPPRPIDYIGDDDYFPLPD
jgi:hypothetical protein